MTPDQHYFEAERLIALAEREKNGTVEERLVARAQVHATLALRETEPVRPPRTGASALAEHLLRRPPQ